LLKKRPTSGGGSRRRLSLGGIGPLTALLGHERDLVQQDFSQETKGGVTNKKKDAGSRNP